MISRRTESNDILLELVAKTLAVGATEMQVWAREGEGGVGKPTKSGFPLPAIQSAIPGFGPGQGGHSRGSDSVRALRGKLGACLHLCGWAHPKNGNERVNGVPVSLNLKYIKIQ